VLSLAWHCEIQEFWSLLLTQQNQQVTMPVRYAQIDAKDSGQSDPENEAAAF
jgi:hypothetical protein